MKAGGGEMMGRTCALLVVSILALVGCQTPVRAEVAVGDEAAAAIAETALAYCNALLASDLTTSWQLLSWRSRSEMSAVEWEESFRTQPRTRTPPASSLLQRLTGGETPAEVGELLLTPKEALAQVSGVVRITQEIVLVKEGDRWLVDLPASDELNVRAAAERFLEAVREDMKGASEARRGGRAGASMPTLQIMLAPEARDYYVLEADIQGDRAHVTLACDLPVSAVVRAVRLGPGWVVDLSRPVVSVDLTSSDPLRAAMDSAYRATCQEQLQKLSRAFDMYGAASDDRLPDPDRWVEMVRPFMPADLSLHCPADPSPGISYAMNRNLAGKRRSQIARPSATPLLFESTLHTDNPSDTGESWPAPAVHSDGNLVLYVDGSVRPMQRKPLFDVEEGEAVSPAPARAVPGRGVLPRRPGRAP
jgi:hypothetical protein